MQSARRRRGSPTHTYIAVPFVRIYLGGKEVLPDSAFLDSAPVCCPPPPPLFMVSSWPFPLSLSLPRCPMRINQSLGTEGKRLLFLSPLSFLATAPIRSEEDNKAVLQGAVFIPPRGILPHQHRRRFHAFQPSKYAVRQEGPLSRKGPGGRLSSVLP